MVAEMQTPVKRRLGKWETDVTVGNTVYTFVGWTRHGSAEQAVKFIDLTNKEQASGNQ